MLAIQNDFLLVREPSRFHKPETLELPEDLTLWVPGETMVAWSHEAAREWFSLPDLHEIMDLSHSASRINWLAMMLFCYASGRWSSVAIAKELDGPDTELRAFAVRLNSWQEIMQFRRISRNTLRCCLAFLLQRVWQAWETGVSCPSQPYPSILNPIQSNLDYASSSWFLTESDARIRFAASHYRLDLED